MAADRRSLGLLLSTSPGQPGFTRGLRVARTALARQVNVYLYCIDDGVEGLEHPELQALKARGLKLFACAYAAQRRNLAIGDLAIPAGLALLSDLIAATDRFVAFG